MSVPPGVTRADGRRLTFAVLIATYGRPAGLLAAIESLQRQTLLPDEIVIAFWSGDAPTRSVVDTLTATSRGQRPILKVVTTAENTVSAKENAAMAAATSDILCFVDDDAVARPQWLERLARHYHDPGVGAVGGRDVLWNADRAVETPTRTIGRLTWFGRLHMNHHRFSQGSKDVDFLKGCNMSYRREVLTDIDPRLVGAVPYGFEIDLGLSVRDVGRRIVYDPQAVVDHYASSNMSAGQSGLSYVTNHNQTYVVLKHLPAWKRVIFLLYSFLLGDKNTIGLARIPWVIARERWSAAVVASHFQGKVAGVWTFLAFGRAAGLAPRRPGASERVARLWLKTLGLLGLLAAAAGVGWLVTAFHAAEHPQLITGLAVTAAATCCVLRWRWGVYALVVYVSLEGLLINGLYPATAPLLFKDVLLGATYTGFLVAVFRGQERWPIAGRVLFPMVALTGLCLAEAVNPTGVDPAVTLIGLRVLVFYIPLFVLGMALATRGSALMNMARLVLYTSVPITLFGIVEWAVGPRLVAGLGPGFARSIWIIGGEAIPRLIYRPTSTFDFVGHFGAYLLFLGILSFAAVHLALRPLERVLLLGVFLSVLVTVVIEAQRSTWILLPIGALGMYLLHRERRAILQSLPALLVGIAVALVVGGSVLTNRLPLLTSGQTYVDRFYGTTGGRFASTDLLRLTTLVGHGTGTALGATRYVTGGVVPSAFESGWYIPFYMFGLPGLAVYLWLYAAVLREVWRGIRTLGADRWLGIGLFCFLILTATVDGSINYPPTNVYFWLFAGLLAGLPACVRDPAAMAAAAGAATRVQSASPALNPGHTYATAT